MNQRYQCAATEACEKPALLLFFLEDVRRRWLRHDGASAVDPSERSLPLGLCQKSPSRSLESMGHDSESLQLRFKCLSWHP